MFSSSSKLTLDFKEPSVGFFFFVKDNMVTTRSKLTLNFKDPLSGHHHVVFFHHEGPLGSHQVISTLDYKEPLVATK